ncbi:MAG: ParB/RepB/Spo0J family partition protein [bacterium]|nr:MAG: ParB/RepB/Spo0J family partition protein [bacterium]
MTSGRKRQALGKGLGALIPGGEDAGRQGELVMAPIDEVFPNPEQPRRRFRQETLEELAGSIREQGVLQPVLARRVPGGYELLAGERRLRAARLAGLERVPILIKSVEEDRKLELALIENIQRENLNPVEEAQAYRELQALHGYTQEELGRKVGKDRATVANALRLLTLPEFVRKELVEGTISAGHARSLLPLRDERSMRLMVDRIVKKGLSVREVERAVSRALSAAAAGRGKGRSKSAEALDLENRLSRKLGCRVRIHEGVRGGRLEIRYGALEELNAVVQKLLKS